MPDFLQFAVAVVCLERTEQVLVRKNRGRLAGGQAGVEEKGRQLLFFLDILRLKLTVG